MYNKNKQIMCHVSIYNNDLVSDMATIFNPPVTFIFVTTIITHWHFCTHEHHVTTYFHINRHWETNIIILCSLLSYFCFRKSSQDTLITVTSPPLKKTSLPAPTTTPVAVSMATSNTPVRKLKRPTINTATVSVNKIMKTSEI